MTMHEKVAGVWKEISAAHENVSGIEKEITEGWERVAGIWKQLYQSVRVQLVGGTYQTVTLTPTDAVCQYRLQSTGEEQADQGSGFVTVGTWLLRGAAADYECRYTFTGDTADVTIGSNGVWEVLSTARVWGIQDTASAGFQKEITGTIEIRDAATLEVLASKTLTLQAEESA